MKLSYTDLRIIEFGLEDHLKQLNDERNVATPYERHMALPAIHETYELLQRIKVLRGLTLVDATLEIVPV